MLDELEDEIGSGNNIKLFNAIKEAIFFNAEGVQLSTKLREPLKYGSGLTDEFAYRKGRVRVLSFMDGNAEVIATGIDSKRDEDYARVVEEMREIQNYYFDLKNRNELITIDEGANII
jgi:hypothetical protein